MDKPSILLIHGTWAHAKVWGKFATALENLGFEVHAPSLRYHDLPIEQGAEKIAHLSLTDYVDDLSTYLLSLEKPPIILGHSLGGLLAQLVAARHPQHQKGLILLGTAPMAGIFTFYPSMMATFMGHYLQWGFWKKPLYPQLKILEKYIMNRQPKVLIDSFYQMLVTESGRVYAEMALWFLDKRRAAQVNTQVIETPVLLISGTEDKVVNYRISQDTAKRYKHAKFVLLQGSDHMYCMGDYLPITLQHIQQWLTEQKLL